MVLDSEVKHRKIGFVQKKVKEMSVKHEVLYLSRRDLEEVALTTTEILEVVEDVFRQKGRGHFEMPPKLGIHPFADGSIHAMPAWLPSHSAVGCKWVSGYAGNAERGLPHLSGLLILNDPTTGLPISIMDCTWITAKRTGAATTVAAKYLAKESASTVAVIGCGVQGRSNFEALVESLPNITSVRPFDTVHEKTHRFASEAKMRWGVEAYPAKSPRDALKSADIVVTATPMVKNRAPVIRRTWLEEGCFYAPLDFDSCWAGAALKSIEKFCTDDIPQLVHCQREGFFKEIPHIYAELGEIVCGSKPGRENDLETIMAMNLGIGLEDVATGIRVYNLAIKKRVGTWLPL